MCVCVHRMFSQLIRNRRFASFDTCRLSITVGWKLIKAMDIPFEVKVTVLMEL